MTINQKNKKERKKQKN